MSGMNGIGTKLQIGKQSARGTVVVATQMINFLKESFKQDPELAEEDTVLGAISARAQDIVAYNAAGGWEGILKPEDAIAQLALALGFQATPTVVAGTTEVYRHVITPVDAVTELPYFSAIIDRKLHEKAYVGCQINELTLSAKSKDYVRAVVSCTVFKEQDGDIVAGLTAPTKKAYRFAGGKFLIDSVEFADVSAMEFKLSNAQENGEPTLGSGLYPSDKLHGIRKFTVSADSKFTTQMNTLIETKYKVGETVACRLIFQSPEIIETVDDTDYLETITIDIPILQLTAAPVNIDGKNEIPVKIEGTALEGVAAPVTVTVQSAISTIY